MWPAEPQRHDGSVGNPVRSDRPRLAEGTFVAGESPRDDDGGIQHRAHSFDQGAAVDLHALAEEQDGAEVVPLQPFSQTSPRGSRVGHAREVGGGGSKSCLFETNSRDDAMPGVNAHGRYLAGGGAAKNQGLWKGGCQVARDG